MSDGDQTFFRNTHSRYISFIPRSSVFHPRLFGRGNQLPHERWVSLLVIEYDHPAQCRRSAVVKRVEHISTIVLVNI